MKGKRGGIYLHIPVCRRKCLYCSFYSVGERLMPDWQRFTDALLREMDLRLDEAEGWEAITIYFGGGTPSLMPPEELKRLSDGIISRLKKINHDVLIPEVTLEVNPDDVNDERARLWKETGVNRISMGVQTLDDNELKAIGRRHDAATALDAYGILREYFRNVSLDLMFGLPGQTLQSLERTTESFIELRPEHISAYSLMYEERSALTRMRDAGKIKETGEDISVEMFRLISDRLSEAGYVRYEISNYALPDKESRHNSSYWDGIPYMGLGPSAHSYDGDRVRKWNLADINGYIAGAEQGSIPAQEEVLTEEELREERIMTQLRKREGIDLKRFEEDFGEKALRVLLEKARKYIDAGDLEKNGFFIRLTDKGVMISDEIMVELF